MCVCECVCVELDICAVVLCLFEQECSVKHEILGNLHHRSKLLGREPLAAQGVFLPGGFSQTDRN